MSGERFSLDTNILVYSVDSSAGPKHALAQQMVGLGMRLDCWLALQALSEFFVVVTRKKRVPASEAAAHVHDLLQLFRTVPASSLSLRTALEEASANRASFWDGLLVATVAEAGCTALLTEDMADSLVVRGVRIINPFGGSHLSPAASRLLLA